MKNFMKNIIEKTKELKAWGDGHHIDAYVQLPVFALVSFFWVYLITGSLKTSIVYLISGFIASLLRLFMFRIPEFQNKAIGLGRKIGFVFAFVFISIAAFCATLYMTDALITFISTITWIILYVTFANAKRMTQWTVGAILPFCLLLYAEFMQDNLRVACRYLFNAGDLNRIGYQLSLTLILFSALLFSNVFNSKRIGHYITGGLFGLLSIVNFFVYACTEQPFTLSDIKIATTAAGVLKSQALEASDWLRFASGILLLIAYFFVVTIVYKRKQAKKKRPWRIASSVIVCVLAVGIFFASSFWEDKILLYQGNVKYSFIGNFYITMNQRIDIPGDAKDYVIEDQNDEGDYKPNVIIIMNEAFSDLETTFDISLSEDPLAYFHELQKEYPHGVTYSSVKGNNTCSSEWELLSGSPTALTAKGAMIYKDNDIPMRSIVSLFNSRDYTTVGYHPYYGFGYNRNNVYHNLGFDQIVFIEDIAQDLNKHRGFVTDEENYAYLIDLYEKNEAAGDQPFFCFNITMQNHGGYKTEQSDDIRVKGEKAYSDVNTYLSGLRYSDEALKKLISYFSSVEEDTIILIFGDHQPLVDNVFYEDIYGKSYMNLSLEELKEVYATPYLIWANYDLDEEAAPEQTSNCYLTNILFEVGGIPKSTWLNMVDEYQKEYPVITEIFTMNSRGEILETPLLLQSKKNLSNDPLNLYQKYSYGILYGFQ